MRSRMSSTHSGILYSVANCQAQAYLPHLFHTLRTPMIRSPAALSRLSSDASSPLEQLFVNKLLSLYLISTDLSSLLMFCLLR